MHKTAGFIGIFTAALLLLAGCGNAAPAEDAAPTVASLSATEIVPAADTLTENKLSGVIQLTNGDKIEIELYPDAAPLTVQNFVSLAEDGFYNGTIFHRAVDGFVIQGGGYDADLEHKESDVTVKGEFAANGVDNKLHHDRGVISMARIPNDNDSASTQFFIVLEDNRASLDGQYAAFGKVVNGMDVADNIAISDKMPDPPAGLEDLPENIYEIESIIIGEKE